MNFETVQVVIIAALSISTILLTIIGLQLIFLLKDLRTLIRRAEYITSGFAHLTRKISDSLTEADTLVNGAKFIMQLVSKFTSSKKKHDK